MISIHHQGLEPQAAWIKHGKRSQLGLHFKVTIIWSCHHLPATKMKGGVPGGSVVKNLPGKQEMQVRSLSWEDPLEKEMVTHSSILSGRIPWTEEPGGLQSMQLQTVGHELATREQQQDGRKGMKGNLTLL